MTSAALEFRFFYFTNNYDEVVLFYRDGLGLEIVGTWDRAPQDRGTIFRSPNGSGLIEIEAGTQGPPPRGGLYIEVRDVDHWHTRAKNKALNITSQIANTSYGHRSFRLVDPGGLEIGFFSKLVR